MSSWVENASTNGRSVDQRLSAIHECGIARSFGLVQYPRMAIALAFILGMGNFAWHRAVLESGHPMVRDMTPGALQSMRIFSLALEFFLLCGALYAARAGQGHWVWAYLAYSLINGAAAWAIVKGRL